MTTTTASQTLRDFIYLDFPRVRSLASQFDVSFAGDASDLSAQERLFAQVEPALLNRPTTVTLGPDFDFDQWKPDAFSDGQIVCTTGVVRLLDYSWLAQALGNLPAVLKKMSKIEMAALRNSEEGKRMSKSALQARSLENQNAIQKVEEFRIDELSDSVRQLYGDITRIKIRPSKAEPRAVLVGSCYAHHFYDTPAALSQKYGIEIDAGWIVVGQLNMPNLAAPPMAVPIGNQTEDSFEQIALLMNNAFKVANAPAFPALSMTPIAIYRTMR